MATQQLTRSLGSTTSVPPVAAAQNYSRPSGLHHAFILPVLCYCYLYILFYALSGSKPNSERYARA